MKIVIIGGGKIGSAIAEPLTKEGHNITVVDSDRSVTERIGNSLDCMTICGSGTTLATLREAGVPDSDLIIACTAQDELNMLCCVFAKKLGCRGAIARVRTPEYAEQFYLLQDELGLSMTINPEQNAARELFRLLEIPGVLKRDTFAKGRIEIVEIIPKAGDILDGVPLMELQKKLKSSVLVGAVERDGSVTIPDGSFTLRAGDHVYLCAPATEIVRMLRAIGEYRKKADDVLLIGGSKIAGYLMGMLSKSGTHVKLIERDPEKARSFAERFPEATVVCADGTVEAVLREERASDMDAVALLTNHDEENIILAMYLSGFGVPQILTKVDHAEFGRLLPGDTNRIISPCKLCADTVIRYVRALLNSGGSSVIAMHHIIDGKVDALEFQVTEACRGAGKTLREIHLKPNILITTINRKGRIIVPGGADTLEAGDTVVVMTASNRVILDLNDIFAGGD